MKVKLLILFLFLSLVSEIYCSVTWRLPNARLRYNQVAFLTSHNSYSAKNHGFLYAQQLWSIPEQLEHGVRGFMLDTYNPARFTKNKEVVLCHGGLVLNRFLRKGKGPMALKESLGYIKQFLNKHPEEIVTIFLENYVRDTKFLDKSIRDSGIQKYILKPSDWNPCQQASWPTLRWMQQQNKRLIIFNSLAESKFTYNEWHHVIENQYGTLVIKQACRERRESAACAHHKRHLYLVNYIPTFKINFGKAYTKVNSTKLKQLLDELYNNGLIKTQSCKKRRPNFINVDFVNEGNALKFVNKINKRVERDLMVRKSKKQPSL